jgi:hypothetical protein
LPEGKPSHVYAYGRPSTLSPSLRLATRGLITTAVNGQDPGPYLSLGVLHRLQAGALAFKTDDSGSKSVLEYGPASREIARINSTAEGQVLRSR